MLGIDIGTHLLRIVWIDGKKRLRKFHTVSYQKPIRTEKGIVDPAFLAGEIRSILSNLSIKERRCACALPSSGVLLSRAGITKVKGKSTADLVMDDVRGRFSLPDEFEVSFDLIRETKDEIDVFVGVASSDLVGSYETVFEVAGLELVRLSVDILSLSRICEILYGKGRFLLMDCGSRCTRMAVLEEGIVVSTREVSRGARDVIESASQALKVPVEELERVSRDATSLKEIAARITRRNPQDAETASILLEAQVMDFSSRLREEVERFIIFQDEKPERALLTGGGAGYVEAALKDLIPSEIIDPFPVLSSGVTEDVLSMKHILTLAVSLGYGG
jgi:Tfp pilus assembly PilM family ATPase